MRPFATKRARCAYPDRRDQTWARRPRLTSSKHTNFPAACSDLCNAWSELRHSDASSSESPGIAANPLSFVRPDALHRYIVYRVGVDASDDGAPMAICAFSPSDSATSRSGGAPASVRSGHLFQGRLGCVAMDEGRRLNAMRYLASIRCAPGSAFSPAGGNGRAYAPILKGATTRWRRCARSPLAPRFHDLLDMSLSKQAEFAGFENSASSAARSAMRPFWPPPSGDAGQAWRREDLAEVEGMAMRKLRD